MTAGTDIDTAKATALKLGEEHGRAAASWYFDGNTTDETYRAVLRGIDEGDPQILDTFPSSPLSGEWADGMTPALLVEECGVANGGPDDAAQDALVEELCGAYEDAYADAVHDEIERAARYQV